MDFMIVDDSQVIRTKIVQVLDTDEFNIVGTASDGVSAVEQFQALKPRVVTLDLTMPRMDGIETIKRMIDIDSDVRILVVSALADKATLIEAMKLGAYGFLCKPFTDAELIEAIEELIEDIV